MSITAFVLVAGLTGSLLAFYSELDAALNPDLLIVPARSGARLDLDALRQRIEEALPHAEVTGFSLTDLPWRSISATVEGRPYPWTGQESKPSVSEAYVDPYDGHLLGSRDTEVIGLGPRHIMAFVYKLHYSLALPGAWGVWLMGGVAILWFFDNFVGAYLTFPLRHAANSKRALEVKQRLAKSWWSRWMPAWRIKTGGSAYRVVFDLHRAAGLWFWALLGILALSSIYLNLSREVFNPVLGLFATVTPYPEDFPKRPAVVPHLPFSKAAAAARNALPAEARDLRLSFIGLDKTTNIMRVGFGYADSKREWLELRQENIFLDGTTGRVVARFGSESAKGIGDQFSALLFPLHSGQILGLEGRILICLVGLAIAGLSITGVLIWWRKYRARKVTKSAQLTHAAVNSAWHRPF